MKLWAISDLHIGVASNRAALDALPAYPDDWLIVGGDVGEKLEHMDHAMRFLTERFAKVIWTPGNHELWTSIENGMPLRGVAKYDALVALCRRYGVVTPEDEYPLWHGFAHAVRIAPIFTLFDYSFRPPEIAEDDALAWAAETNIVSSDELYLKPDPFPIAGRLGVTSACAATPRRVSPRLPLAQSSYWSATSRWYVSWSRCSFIERFSLWCGTTLTRDWHTRFNAAVVVYGHLHVRSSEWRDGVRFEEVSLGMARQWDQSRGLAGYLRQVFPGESAPPGGVSPALFLP